MFGRISVTANKWVPMDYVAEDGLGSYLMQVRVCASAYICVAVEGLTKIVCVSKSL